MSRRTSRSLRLPAGYFRLLGGEPSGGVGAPAPDPVVARWGVAAALWVAGYAVATVASQGHADALRILNNAVYLAPVALCTVLSALAVSHSPRDQRPFWIILTASNGLWLGGEIVWSAYAFTAHRPPPFPSLADVLYIASYLLVLPALARGFRGRLRGISWGSLVNLFLIVGGLTVAGYSVLIGPQAVYGASFATATGVAYPLLGLAILILLTAVGVGSARPLPVTMVFVGAAFAVSAGTDAAYTYLTVLHQYVSGSVLDIGWQTEAVGLCLAALIAIRDGERPRTVRHSASDVTNAIVLLVSAATLGALIVAIGDKVLNKPTALAVVAALMAAQFRLYADARRQERRAVQQAADNRYLALHDELTGLPNRRLFHQRTHLAVETARVDGIPLAVLLMDLDRFKEINDTLGHHNGDLLLQEIGSRLSESLAEADMVARLGGDEFAILLREVPDALVVTQTVESIGAILAQPFQVQGMWLDSSASIGVALFPEHGDDVDVLIQRADVAMYVAKETRAPCVVYSPQLDRHTTAGLAMVSDLRGAVESGDLVLHYQPKVSLSTGSVVGVEALLRWRHPTRGLVMPDDFIPVAEQTGLIKPLTTWVLQTALLQCRSWHDAGMRLPISVNLSPRTLFDVHLPDEVERLLLSFGLPPDVLVLEITEGAVMANPRRALGLLERLNDMGVQLSIDDFGVGYSSLTYLKVLPVWELKIDKSFVAQMVYDRSDAQIVRSTIDLAHNLGLRVVAEGVDSAEVRDELAALHCDVAQGYWFSRPVPEPELRDWLVRRLPDVA